MHKNDIQFVHEFLDTPSHMMSIFLYFQAPVQIQT